MENGEKQRREEEWHRDPKNWIWGIFYFNKSDERVFLPKKIPEMGFTVNFGNRTTLQLLLMIIFVVAVLGLLRFYRV